MAPPSAVGPQVHPSSVIAPGAVLIGQVIVEENCFIGPNAVLRGDIEPIAIRKNANVQDCVVIHTHHGSPVEVGEGVSIGHGAVVHGAVLEPRCLIGMNAVVLDHAVVGEQSVVGAAAVVPSKFQVPPKSLVVGAPCKVVKENDERIAKMAYENAEHYAVYREEHLAGKWKTIVGPLNDNGSFTQ